MVFAKLNCKPRWRKRLPELAIPTLVVHGRRDPFFPVATAKRSRARSPVPDCSCSMRPRPRSPMRPPVKSRRRCSRARRSRIEPTTDELDLEQKLPLLVLSGSPTRPAQAANHPGPCWGSRQRGYDQNSSQAYRSR
jgi:hypothetical protein